MSYFIPPEGITAYSISLPYPKGDLANVELSDDSFDGSELGGRLRGGLGQLTDGVKERQDEEGRKEEVLGGRCEGNSNWRMGGHYEASAVHFVLPEAIKVDRSLEGVNSPWSCGVNGWTDGKH